MNIPNISNSNNKYPATISIIRCNFKVSTDKNHFIGRSHGFTLAQVAPHRRMGHAVSFEGLAWLKQCRDVQIFRTHRRWIIFWTLACCMILHDIINQCLNCAPVKYKYILFYKTASCSADSFNEVQSIANFFDVKLSHRRLAEGLLTFQVVAT